MAGIPEGEQRIISGSSMQITLKDGAIMGRGVMPLPDGNMPTEQVLRAQLERDYPGQIEDVQVSAPQDLAAREAIAAEKAARKAHSVQDPLDLGIRPPVRRQDAGQFQPGKPVYFMDENSPLPPGMPQFPMRLRTIFKIDDDDQLVSSDKGGPIILDLLPTQGDYQLSKEEPLRRISPLQTLVEQPADQTGQDGEETVDSPESSPSEDRTQKSTQPSRNIFSYARNWIKNLLS